MEVKCEICTKTFERTKRTIDRQIKKNNGVFICSSCSKLKKPSFSIGLDNAKMRVEELGAELIAEEWKNNKCEYKFIGKCGHSFTARYDNTLNIAKKRGFMQCPSCSNNAINKSKQEDELFLFIKSLGVNAIQGYRKRKDSFEYDIYCPDYKLAIEYHGVYWHSEQVLRTKTKKRIPSVYHRDKYNEATKDGDTLLQIFGSEWEAQKDIIKDIISAKLGKIENKVGARKCELKQISSSDANKFLTRCHIFGSLKGSSHFGLFYENNAVAVMSVSYFSNKDELYITRYATSLNFSVMGGFSKMLKHIEKVYETATIISYADKRFSNGAVYEKNGFVKEKESSPSYWYFKNGKANILINRRSFQKKYIEKKFKNGDFAFYDSNLTEYENMLKNNYDRIWDAGHIKYIIKKGN